LRFKLKLEENIPGVVKRCLCAIIHIENFQKRNPLNLSLKKPKHCIYVAVQRHKRRLTAIATITARKSDGY